ncbi:MAG: hypothetical protein QW806_01655 [Nitrososphaerota archaeon]
MINKNSLILLSLMLSAIFSIALLYSTIELPHILNKFLIDIFPDYGFQWDEAEKFINSIRPISYICFIATISLIITGLVLKKSQLSFLGSFILYLPTFSYFASVMFFLTGIGIIRFFWLPIIEIFPGSWSEKIYAASYFLELGDFIYMPYDILRFIFTNLAKDFPLYIFDNAIFYLIIYLSAFIFFLSCASWFYGKFKGLKIIDFFIYKYSRHPQYLSFLIWSYGLLIYDKYIFYPPKGGYFASPPIFWLIVTFIIIGLALYEEKEMIKTYDEAYIKYRGKTPFMLPLPKVISNLILFPMKLFFKKAYPEKNIEIFSILTIYFTILVIISLFY